MAKSKVQEFYESDYNGTLYPMDTCKYVIDNAPEELSDFIKKISDPKEKEYSFLPQETVYASKIKHQLRRTKKLDPVAEFYIYDMAYSNRKIFRKSKIKNRRNYGYIFDHGNPVDIHESYTSFNKRFKQLRKKYKYFIQFDISSYFNSIYHHDLTNWFSSQKTKKEDSDLFSKFMREINSGFSVDFLPHGLYPTKMIGSHFLTYVDYSKLIKCEHMIRFMDDFIICSDSKDTLINDFRTIQKILGQKSLNLNPDKTVLFKRRKNHIDEEISKVLEQVNIHPDFEAVSGSGFDPEEMFEGDGHRELTTAEVKRLIKLLDKEGTTDQEAGLILDCIHEHSSSFVKNIFGFIYNYPYLAKKLYHKCEIISNYEILSKSIKRGIESTPSLNEYQLFWLAKITETYLLDTSFGGDILALLYQHKDATNISMAKVLEIPESRFGMPEWREVHLKNGTSGWLAWASAVGTRKDNKQIRSYLMKYFSKSSPINKLIADCLMKN